MKKSPLRDLALEGDCASALGLYSQVVELMQLVDMHINGLAHIEEMHIAAESALIEAIRRRAR
jgi:hypothetical protein